MFLNVTLYVIINHFLSTPLKILKSDGALYRQNRYVYACKTECFDIGVSRSDVNVRVPYYFYSVYSKCHRVLLIKIITKNNKRDRNENLTRTIRIVKRHLLRARKTTVRNHVVRHVNRVKISYFYETSWVALPTRKVVHFRIHFTVYNYVLFQRITAVIGKHHRVLENCRSTRQAHVSRHAIFKFHNPCKMYFKYMFVIIIFVCAMFNLIFNINRLNNDRKKTLRIEDDPAGESLVGHNF